ncbi:hypothetical protein ACFE04_005717 [Oxalis oulophora]
MSNDDNNVVVNNNMSTSVTINEPLLNRDGSNRSNNYRYARTGSHAYDELQSFRSFLRWLCVDQSTILTACTSWSMFVLFTFVVPLVSHFVLACSSCDAEHERPFDAVVQLSLSCVATLSYLYLSRFVSKFGLRRFLFFDKLCDESETVRTNYTLELNRSLKILSIFVIPCITAECAYKIWWYASGASQIPFLGNVILSDTVACIMEICSWLYRIMVFFLVCVLFRLICHLQILRLIDFARVFEGDSDVSQFASLLSATKASAKVDMFIAGELAKALLAANNSDDEVGDEEDEMYNSKLIPTYASSTMAFQKRQALVIYFENNRAGITVYGFTLDRTTLHTIFGIEMSLVLWLLGKTIGIS